MVNLNLVPEKVKVASSLMIIIGIVDIVIDLYRKDPNVFALLGYGSVIINVLLGVVEMFSGYCIFYGKRLGWFLGLIMGTLEIIWGVEAIITDDYAYLINLVFGILFISVLLSPSVRKYCFDSTIPKPTIYFDKEYEMK